MTMQLDLDKLEALHESATEAPWAEITGWYSDADEALCVALRNAAPALLAEVRQLREENQQLRLLLQQVQTIVADTEDVGDIAGMFWVSGLDERIKETLGNSKEV